MASLTPGTLVTLLQSMNSPKPTTHRLPLLQLIGIVPSLSESHWATAHGFFLNLSDSKNSCYVSLSGNDDSELILSNKVQLGQFVHVERFEFVGSGVPRVVGLRAVKGMHRFYGEPEMVLVRVSKSGNDFFVQPVHDSDEDPLSALLTGKIPDETKVDYNEQNGEAKKYNTRRVLAPKDNETVGKEEKSKLSDNRRPQRFSSPGSSKQRSVSVGKKTPIPMERDPSSAGKAKRSSSPVPSKCMVPSLVAARDENRKVAREPAIVVPSRYRQPSPTGVRRQSSPNPRRMSISPGRRSSSGVKTDSASRKKMASIVAGITKASDALVGTGKGRKGWDEQLAEAANMEPRDKGFVKSKPDFDAILRTQAAISRRLSDVHSQKLMKDENEAGEKAKSSSKEAYSSPAKASLALGINIHEKKWTDGSVPFDAVSENLAKLGKDAIQRKSIASKAAAEALEEAIATESIVRNLCMFSELSSVSKRRSFLPTVDRFMTIYPEVVKSIKLAESIATNHSSLNPLENVPGEHLKSEKWVEAALATDLEIVSLLTDQVSEPRTTPQKRLPKRESLCSSPKKLLVTSSASRDTLGKKWIRGNGMNDTVKLGKDLQMEMQSWLIQFVDESMDAGFQVLGKSTKENGANCDHITAILSRLKHVKEWLDQIVVKKDQVFIRKVEHLKNKIFGFAIQQNVGMGVSISST